MRNDLSELRQSVTDLIEAAPTTITLKREQAVREYGGTSEGAPVDQPPRDRWLTPLNRITDPRLQIPDVGEGWQVSHLIVGEYDDDMQNEDTFFVRGDEYRIVDVENRSDYEIRALCATRQRTATAY